jgi:hypothetical protein
LVLTFALASLVSVASAEDTLRICIYGDNRGSNEVHRTILREAQRVTPRMFVIDGDVVKYDYGQLGTPEAVLQDYRKIFATHDNSLSLWPATPGPVVFVAAGGHDEQYFLDPETAAIADTSKGRRYAYEGRSNLGVQLYDAFRLDEMRIRVQPLTELTKPLPRSRFGDYFVIVGVGSRRDVALLVLYRSDRWGFQPEQVDWIEQTLAAFRKMSPSVPLIAVAHDWTWYLPDVTDDGSTDGSRNAVSNGTPQADQSQKQRLFAIMTQHNVDLAIASDLHAYWADTSGSLLRINCGAAICRDPDGEIVAADNAWIEYAQTNSRIQIRVHPIDPPIGCGLREEAAAYGVHFEKNRTAGSTWRQINN